MGIVFNGIPHALALELAQINRSAVFVETGTYEGRTARWAAEHFGFVFTIERSPALHARAAQALAGMKHVEPLCGDTRALLKPIVEGLHALRAIHWLDAHWSGGSTAGEDAECPLLDELQVLAGRHDDIILIDDARLFLSAPPQPHRPEAWPSIVDIARVACPDKRRHLQIVDDVIVIVPNRPELVGALTAYAQQRATAFWQAFGQMQQRGLPAAA